MTLSCHLCDKAPTEAERVLAERYKGAKDATGWLCTACRPEGYPADGLMFHVVDVGGASPAHEYGS